MQWYPTAHHHTDADCRRYFVMGFLLLPNTGVFQNRREGHDGRTTKVSAWIEGDFPRSLSSNVPSVPNQGATRPVRCLTFGIVQGVR
jgi:hypothetical protein